MLIYLHYAFKLLWYIWYLDLSTLFSLSVLSSQLHFSCILTKIFLFLRDLLSDIAWNLFSLHRNMLSSWVKIWDILPQSFYMNEVRWVHTKINLQQVQMSTLRINISFTSTPRWKFEWIGVFAVMCKGNYINILFQV